MRKQIREDETEREARVKAVADFLKSILQLFNNPHAVFRRQSTATQMESRVAAAIPSTSYSAEIYETPKLPRDDDDFDVDDNDVADGFVKEEAERYGRKQFSAMAIPHLSPYLYK